MKISAEYSHFNIVELFYKKEPILHNENSMEMMDISSKNQFGINDQYTTCFFNTNIDIKTNIDDVSYRNFKLNVHHIFQLNLEDNNTNKYKLNDDNISSLVSSRIIDEYKSFIEFSLKDIIKSITTIDYTAPIIIDIPKNIIEISE